MELKSHQTYLRDALKVAAECVRDKDWLEASQYYAYAAHHAAVIAALKAAKPA
jgi:hypothetical protein